MKAIILSAGQGKRLLPLTKTMPKSLLELDHGQTILGWQLDQLASAGFEEAIVVSGFQAPQIRKEIQKYQSLLKVREVFNPFHKLADNLGSVWTAHHFMTDDFVILNGDTLFSKEVAVQLKDSKGWDVTLTISRKDQYDDDDMKVCVDAGRLKAVGKTLDRSIVNGESIGMMKFSGRGVHDFVHHVARAMETEDGLKMWYLAVLDQMARSGDVGTIEVASDAWCEVDFPVDYKKACEKVAGWRRLQAGETTENQVAAS